MKQLQVPTQPNLITIEAYERRHTFFDPVDFQLQSCRASRHIYPIHYMLTRFGFRELNDFPNFIAANPEISLDFLVSEKNIMSKCGSILSLNNLIIVDPARFFAIMLLILNTHPEIFTRVKFVDISRSRSSECIQGQGYKFENLLANSRCREFLIKLQERNGISLGLHILDLSYVFHYELSALHPAYRPGIIIKEHADGIVQIYPFSATNNPITPFTDSFVSKEQDPSGIYRRDFLTRTFGLTLAEYLALYHGDHNLFLCPPFSDCGPLEPLNPEDLGLEYPDQNPTPTLDYPASPTRLPRLFGLEP